MKFEEVIVPGPLVFYTKNPNLDNRDYLLFQNNSQDKSTGNLYLVQLKRLPSFKTIKQAVLEIQLLENFWLLFTIVTHWNFSYPTIPTGTPVLLIIFAYFMYNISLPPNNKEHFSQHFSNSFVFLISYCDLTVTTVEPSKPSPSFIQKVITFDWLIEFN